ncbi:hypothetical protein GUITHDRAFT_112144 [Guillardia theta CCMP2712]|uniref:Uncharacterized protein n=2 Tax=Guillardia theta TaxID=55529 RepID=L1IZM6_GUITC|nr:hypothetical protein GUITHDRAFT_112144 [Guillardia theta CCMP2712]EKX41728.1 hypothetical protein GUITHDRAFT_112144 [Guillardia theta CCMP2712]|eukprot:XP_005828708.1 hypothetical protein GUITHDRAFT_112144 [Guillardia theta CCMP2712]
MECSSAKKEPSKQISICPSYGMRSCSRLCNLQATTLCFLVFSCILTGHCGAVWSRTSPSQFFHGIEPEYTCVYDDINGSPDLLRKINVAYKYKNYLSNQNQALKSKVSHSASIPTKAGEEAMSEDTIMLGSLETGEHRTPRAQLRKPCTECVPPVLKQDEEFWHKDVGQRYKELVPPKKRFSCKLPLGMSSQADLRKAVQAASVSNSASISPTNSYLDIQSASGEEQMLDEVVFVTDLDKCAFYGNDGNDLGIALQWMEKSPEQVVQLYEILLNPQVKETYKKLKAKAKKVKVVIYTMRATFLVYRSCFRDLVIPLQWDPSWHEGAQVFFPPTVKTADDILKSYSTPCQLLEEELVDIKKSLERLLATRQVIAKELELDDLPELVVTATPKDLDSTMSRLRLPKENAFLWDDNPKLRGKPKIVSVEPYEALHESKRTELLAFLDRNLPPETLETDLVEFMLSADPRDQVLTQDEESGRLCYQIQINNAQDSWALPELSSSLSSSEKAVDSDNRVILSAPSKDGNGHLSPVTPDIEALESTHFPGPVILRENHHEGLLGKQCERVR